MARLAIGGMAEVCRAEQASIAGAPRTVVVKRMLPHIAAERGARAMFEEEARLGRAVQHPNVVRVLEVGEAEGAPYLAMEHVPGIDLWQLTRWLAQDDRALDVPLAAFVARELCAGLAAVHRALDDRGRPLGIVHGDISPSNVLLSIHGEVKLADFGVARALLASSFPQAAAAGRTRGKLGYLAPEQVRGMPADQRADVFATAAITAELVVGRPLFAEPSELATLLAIREARSDAFELAAPELPPELVAVLRRGLAREAEERLASAQALADGLAPLATDAHARERLAALVVTGTGQAMPELREGPTEEALTAEPPLGNYRVETLQGTRIGPMTFAQVVEAVTLGKLEPGDRVSIEGGPFRELSSLPELASHLPMSRERPTLPAPEPHAVLIADGGLVDGLVRSVAEHATGLWICVRGETRKEIYFLEGKPEFVGSNVAGEMLGEHLVEAGVLTRAELEMALAVMPRFDGRLGDTLTALGLVPAVELFHHLAGQVRDKLLEVFEWTDGRASFQRGIPPPPRGFPLGLDPWRILAAGLDRRLELGLEQDRFGERLTSLLGRHPAARAPSAAIPAEVRDLWSEISRPAPLYELVEILADESNRDPHRPYRAVRMALALGLVAWVEE